MTAVKELAVMEPRPRRYWLTTDMCHLLRCNRDTLSKLVTKGLLPAPVRLHGKLLWPVAEVERALAKIEAAK